ncbi:MAG TPA: D-glucuronyl C5-epimerase family protein [Candidatus Dormibacteraeota bacterium]|nr:D-glucuronyl C5-epimerase family protein [Candidatus Dormibacteraeota bacterium]
MIQGIARTFPLDWSVRREHRIPDARSPGLGPYYIGWDPGHGPYGEGWESMPRDADGALMSLPGDLSSPTVVAQYGLEQHARWMLHGDPASFEAFIAQARWLRTQQLTLRGIHGCYPFPQPWPAYGAPLGFLSAMTQGEAISLLLRAYEIGREQSFLEAAVSAAEPFRHEVGRGGVTWRADGDVYLEEAAVDPPGHILNGWIYALWGIRELRGYHAEPWLAELHDASLDTLRRRLELFDSGHWSYYNLLATRTGFRKLATLKYHAFHIAQLRVLAAMTGDSYFGEVAERWRGYVDSAASRVSVYVNALAGLPIRFLSRADTVPHGARSVV